jgi:hypothetical protein
MFSPEIPELYDAARRTMHDLGFEWTDPRTNVTYPPPRACRAAGECAVRAILRHVERIAIDDGDPIAHTAFYLLACPTCRIVTAFPESNLALVTPNARRALHLELAAEGWWLPWP